MIDTLTTGLQDFAHNVRIIDFLDVALIAIVFYMLLNWLMQSISRRSLVGFLVLLATYFIARFTGMYLTELLLQALFIVILIGLVVVFQSDIRRIVDRIGSWRFFENQPSLSYSNQTTDIITEAVAGMAKKNIGALIVIRGKESWERQIDGGIELNGKVSIPLLYSIFNPSAPGHDGAILLEGDQIKRFGTHLPLSKNLGEKSAGGTRHAAALGLSEHCDALVVAVSEERGTISIARHGNITQLDSSSDLKTVLDEFWQTHYQAEDSTLIDWWKKRNIRAAVSSVLLAVILWFAFAHQPGTVYRTFPAPIEYLNLQSSYILVQDSLPMEARVTLAGPEQAFRSLDPSELRISFDLEKEPMNSDELIITESNINLSNNLQLYDVSPQSLDIKVDDIKQLTVPVKIPTDGFLPDNIELIGIDTDPQTISILTAQSNNYPPDTLATNAIDLSNIDQSTELSKELILPAGVALHEDSPREINISVKVREKID